MKNKQIIRLRSMLMTLMLIAGLGTAWGDTYSYEFTEAVYTADGTQTLGSLDWTLACTWQTAGSTYYGFDTYNNKGIQIGSGSKPVSVATLTTSGISGTVTSVKVNVSQASQGNGTVAVSVGGVNLLSGGNTSVSLTTTSTDVTFEGSGSGDVVITLNQTAKKATYLKSIEITYEAGSTKTDTQTSFPQSSYTASYPGTFTAPTATLTPASAGSLTYSSNNTGVASVDASTGAVTLNAIGTAVITATYSGNSTYNGSSASYTLTVGDGRPATQMSFPSSEYSAIVGETFTSPVATLTAGGTTLEETIAYTTSNTAVASVDASTGEVTINGVGTATITATFDGNDNYQASTASYTLTVTDQSGVGGEDVEVWSEDFSAFNSGSQPAEGDNATYVCSPSNTKIYTGTMYAGGAEPELLVAKNGGSFTVTVTSLKQCSGDMTLSFKSNRALTLSSTTSGVTFTQASGSPSGTTYTYTVSGATNGFTIVFSNSSSSNARLDDCLLIGTRRTDVTDVSEPTLTNGFTFWPATTETPTASFSVAPSTSGSIVRYTTDGTEPSASNGTIVTAATTVTIHETTTVKAIAYLTTSAQTYTSGVVSETYTLGPTVNDIASFKALDEGTEARLYLDPSKDARVLHVNGGEIYLRDNTGAICMYVPTSKQTAVPAHDQHVAGWIIGQYKVYNGLPELYFTDNTTTVYMAFAEMVNEEMTKPVEIAAADFDNYKADWVTIPTLRVSISGTDTLATAVSDDATALKLYNRKFKVGSEGYYSQSYAYEGALVDLTGIAIPYNTTKEIAPIYYNEARPLVFVLDDTQDFTSPSEDLSGVTVRMVRTLSDQYWNTLTVPFSMEMEGTLREYDKLSADGKTMLFKDAASVTPGTPFLLIPEETIANPIFNDVTLSKNEALTVEDGGYSFVGTYSPVTLKTDQTEQYLKTNGHLAYPTNPDKAKMKGMRAYFVMPAGSQAKLNFGGDVVTLIEELPEVKTIDELDVYTVTGQYVGKGVNLKTLPRGIYIVNGKKMLIK